jgi:hypothetical protein
MEKNVVRNIIMTKNCEILAHFREKLVFPEIVAKIIFSENVRENIYFCENFRENMCKTVANACGSSKTLVVSSIILLFSQYFLQNPKKRALKSYGTRSRRRRGTARELNGKQNQYERRDCGVWAYSSEVRAMEGRG